MRIVPLQFFCNFVKINIFKTNGNQEVIDCQRNITTKIMKPSVNLSSKYIKTIYLIFIAIMIYGCHIQILGEVKVTDNHTGLPLPKASIFDKNGIFIGVTDDNGIVPHNISNFSYPLNIRYVGYLPISVQSPDFGVVTMVESEYNLPEVVVDDVSRNILYIQAYVREYVTFDNSKDTLAIFKEQIVDYAIPIGKAKYKGWKKPRVLDQKEYEYARIEKKKTTIDTLLYSDGGKFRTTNFNIAQKFKMPESILSGDSTEYVKYGKYYPSERWSVVGNSYIYEDDELCDEKGHVYAPGFLKMLGMSAAQTMSEHKYKFEKSGKPGANVENLVEASENFDMIFKGKLFKKATEQNEDTEMSFFAEMFVIDRAYITAEEAKVLKKDVPIIDIINYKLPDAIPAPPEKVSNLKEAVLKKAKF